MSMKLIGFLFLFIFSYQLLFGQLKNKSFSSDTDISSSVAVGTMFGNNFSGTFLAPNINQTINSKLSLNYGAVFSRNSSSYMLIDNTGFGYAMPSGSNTFYVDGSYKLTDKVTFKSTIIVENGSFDNYGKDLQNFSSNMYSMGIEYKINDGLRIQAEIGMGKGQHPYSNLFSPYNQRPYNYGISPFYSPLFGY